MAWEIRNWGYFTRISGVISPCLQRFFGPTLKIYCNLLDKMLNPTTKEALADVSLTMFRKTPKNWNVHFGSFPFSDLPFDMKWCEVT